MSEKVVQLVSFSGNNPNSSTAATAMLADGVAAATSAAFYYQTPALEKLNEALVRSVNDQGFLTVINGEKGSGKSTLLQQFLRQAQPEWALCLIRVKHVIGEKHILEQLNKHFFPAKNYSLESLAQHLLASTDPCWPVIIVDDADKMSSFALKVLLSLKFSIEEQGGHLGLILFALPSIQGLMKSPSLLCHDEIVRNIDIPLLQERETFAYVDLFYQSKLLVPEDEQSEGQDNTPSALSHRQIRAIYRMSGGLPGSINQLIEQCEQRNASLPSQFMSYLLNIKMKPHRWRIAAVLLLIIASAYKGGEWILRDDVSPIKEDMLATQHAPSPLLIAAAPATVTEKARPATLAASLAAEAKRYDKPKEAQLISAPEVKQLIVAVAAPPALVDKEAVKIVAVNVPVDGQNWLMEQDPGDYTIQLAASADEKAINRFIRKQPVIEGMRYVHIVRRDQNWYLTLYGAYPTFSKATKGIQLLPQSLRENDPWIRRISSLQGLLPVTEPVMTTNGLESADDAAEGVMIAPLSSDAALDVDNTVTVPLKETRIEGAQENTLALPKMIESVINP